MKREKIIQELNEHINSGKYTKLSEIEKDYQLSKLEKEYFVSKIDQLKHRTGTTAILYIYGEKAEFWTKLITQGFTKPENIFHWQDTKEVWNLTDIEKKIVWIHSLTAEKAQKIPFTTLTDKGFKLPTKDNFYLQSDFDLIIISADANPNEIFTNQPEELRRIYDGVVLNTDNQAQMLMKKSKVTEQFYSSPESNWNAFKQENQID